MLKPKLRQQEQGFTLLEVIVAILIATVFVTITMQAMVMAALLKTRAKEYSEAIAWVQEDLEAAKYKAALYQKTTLSSAVAQNATSIVVNSADGFVANDTILIDVDSQTYTITGISGNTLTISPGVVNPLGYAANALVVGNKRCNATGSSLGFGAGFQGLIATNQVINPNPKQFSTGRYFTMVRTPTPVNSVPYTRLRIDYEVKPTTGGTAVANMNAEILPDAALRCP